MTWLTQSEPPVAEHLTPAIVAVLEQVADESRDESERLYTQAEMVRAIEIVREGGRFTI